VDVTSVADLGFSKGGFWFYKKFSSELVAKKKGHQPALVKKFQSKLNLASSNTPHLTHCASIPGTLLTQLQKGGMALPSR